MDSRRDAKRYEDGKQFVDAMSKHFVISRMNINRVQL